MIRTIQFFIEENPRVRKLAPVILAIIILAGSWGIVAFASSLQNPYGKGIKIHNLKETVNNLSLDQTNNLQHQLYEMILKNGGEMKQVRATVREGSVEMTQEGEMFYDKFVIDLDEIKQSYLAQLEWSENAEVLAGYPVMLSCVRDTELIKYKEFDCQDDLITNGDERVTYQELSQYLPYAGTVSSGEEFEVIAVRYDTEKEGVVWVSVKSCGKQKVEAEALEAAKEWVGQVGYDPEQFSFNIITEYEKCIVK